MHLRFFDTTGRLACFTGSETTAGRRRDVEGRDRETGTALVVDPKLGALRPVTDYADFSHLEAAHHVVAAMPGGGWRVRWDDAAPDGAPLTEQVLAWLITSSGGATPLTVEANGYVGEASCADACIPPGEELD